MDAETVDILLAAIDGGQWPIVVGVAIMAIVWLARHILGERLPATWAPLVASGLGLLSGVAALLCAGVEWPRALLLGLVSGAAASGWWSLLGRRFLPLGGGK